MSEKNQNNEKIVVEVVSDNQSNESTKSMFEAVTNFFDSIFNKTLPKLPKEFLEFLVKYMPIFNIVGGILNSLSALVNLVAFFTTATIFIILTQNTFIFGNLIGYIISIIGAIISIYFAVKAHPGLESKKAQSWQNIYYGWLSYFIFGILSRIALSVSTFVEIAKFGINSQLAPILSLSGSITSLVFTSLIFGLVLYIVFQLRTYYKN